MNLKFTDQIEEILEEKNKQAGYALILEEYED